MRKHLHINLRDRSVKTEEMHGDAVVRAGRHYIARTLLARGVARIDPLSPDNPLIFSAGPFAGSNFSNANRICVGCRSPLTGGIKEANSGGTFAYALGQLETAGLTLNDASSEWVVIRITKEGNVTFDSAAPYMGKGNFDAAALLFEKYGKKVSFALCGPVGEYLGLMAGITFPDVDGRPSRIAARGGVGAVMGSKKVKAIVVDIDKMPTFHDRKKLMGSIREYGKRVSTDPVIDVFRRVGTAMMGDFTNQVGGLPVNNFSSGRLVEASQGPLKLGGDYIRDRIISRGGQPSHACMPGCQIECSNVYVDESGKELVSPLEYETIVMMGCNCGLDDPDDVARLNFVANDLGVDSIEAGATLSVLMEAKQGAFGDVGFMMAALEDIRRGSERGRLLAQGTARVGAHYKVARVPAIKKQGISAYDPRVIEVTGISMMTTAQGADHTAGHAPTFDCNGKTTKELTAASVEVQTLVGAVDSLGMCIFGRSVTNVSFDLIATAVNDAHGTNFDAALLKAVGRDVLKMELEFNRAAGFTEADDELPAFYKDPVPPTGKVGRHSAAEVNRYVRELLA
ncbi:MAG: aldehyde ferredoxin oxidoreductase [Betaproteobacteria bacterium]|nr:aldehyde ferredoxin oxidoreductase [Betaproteobacteria bacterium]